MKAYYGQMSVVRYYIYVFQMRGRYTHMLSVHGFKNIVKHRCIT